jgi:hypothetical protein
MSPEAAATAAPVPHAASAVAWDVPSPVAVRQSFVIKVGVACPASCRLAGLAVSVRDQSGRVVGDTLLSDQPWPGTAALYWGELTLTAPDTPGLCQWTVQFHDRRAATGFAHDAAAAPFSFRADPLATRRITVTVNEPETGRPIRGAQVWAGVYGAVTDDEGVARFKVPDGVYALTVVGDGWGGPPRTVDVCDDLALDITAVRVPTAAERNARLDEYEASRWG